MILLADRQETKISRPLRKQGLASSRGTLHRQAMVNALDRVDLAPP
jgi:hypothetical protein